MQGRLLALFVALALIAPEAWPRTPTRSLPPALARSLTSTGLALDRLSLSLQRLDGDGLRIEHDAEAARPPASVLKLLTTYAALELLGPARTWTSEAWFSGPMPRGVLSSPLIIRAGGDPGLGPTELRSLLQMLRARGLRELKGGLVLDRSVFELPEFNPGSFDGQALAPYNSGPDALIYNANVVTVRLRPGPPWRAALVAPAPIGLDIIARIAPKEGTCDDWRSGIEATLFERPNIHRLVLTGVMASDCGERDLHLSPLSAPDLFAGSLAAIWLELGGSIDSRSPVKWSSGEAPTFGRPAASVPSQTLASIVRTINKHSSNPMARTLLLSLSTKRPARIEDAERRVHTWLEERGLSTPELVIDNGSGLSRHARWSAAGAVRLLVAAWSSAVWPELVSSLPILGVDGTLARRHSDAPGRTRLRAKTGSLDGVRTLAGYLLPNNGPGYAFALFIEHPDKVATRAAQDAFIAWLLDLAPTCGNNDRTSSGQTCDPGTDAGSSGLRFPP
ncbi:MAG: D-alanyl-D-alanine carboxypeptidase DacB [Rhodocyclaceae bacterium]|nr:D-alanyl-D-alanine carboxypeptidase DacB [Rhodocyclaceae bacterium]